MRDGEPKPEPKPELKLVSATAGGITLVNGKINVPVNKAYKSVGTVEVKFNEEVEIKSVKVGATDHTAAIVSKFGNNKATFAVDVTTTFVDLATKGTAVTVVVEGANGEKTFTIELVVDDVVTVGKLGGRVDSIVTDWNVVIEKVELESIYGSIEQDDVFVLTLGDQVFDLAYDLDNDAWTIAGDEMISATDEVEVKTAVITIK